MQQTTAAKKMCDAEVFDVRHDTKLVAKQNAMEEHGSDHVRAEVVDSYDGGYIVMVFDAAEFNDSVQ